MIIDASPNHTFIDTSPNHLLRIDELWAFISEDETGEGLCAMPLGGTLMPMIAADKERLKVLIPMAEQLAKLTGRKIKMIKLSTREELREFNP